MRFSTSVFNFEVVHSNALEGFGSPLQGPLDRGSQGLWIAPPRALHPLSLRDICNSANILKTRACEASSFTVPCVASRCDRNHPARSALSPWRTWMQRPVKKIFLVYLSHVWYNNIIYIIYIYYQIHYIILY